MLREYKLTNSWKPSGKEIIDMTFMAAGIVAVLQQEKLSTYNLVGEVIEVLDIGLVFDRNCRIACLNDCNIAVTEPCNNLIKIVTIIVPTPITDLGTPAGTNMTGGITCRMDTLYVAFSDAIRLMDLSGQIQKVISIPSVNILHFVNNDKMLCVYSKKDSDKTMSCLDFSRDSLYDFEPFPFHPKQVTTDDVGNMIFLDDGVIWQGDSDGKNTKIMISVKVSNPYERLTYEKDSKTLLTYQNIYSSVKVYRKLE
ncbi:unnamed protein product [Mytilus coruscus]|uniref:Uncharacterized protein n=1 Tax=Mytilus coruscus TaxID=42192 RepID=A0A6J8D5C3_MYTCO|nr:unnamed protein product [Mytilus coruscus]